MTPPQTQQGTRRTCPAASSNRLASGGQCVVSMHAVLTHSPPVSYPLPARHYPLHSINRRGAAGGDTAAAAAGDGDDADAAAAERAKNRAAAAALADDTADMTPAQAAKKARVSAMFEQLHQTSTGSANKLSKSTISLASLCSNTDPKKKRNTDLVGEPHCLVTMAVAWLVGWLVGWLVAGVCWCLLVCQDLAAEGSSLLLPLMEC